MEMENNAKLLQEESDPLKQESLDIFSKQLEKEPNLEVEEEEEKME